MARIEDAPLCLYSKAEKLETDEDVDGYRARTMKEHVPRLFRNTLIDGSR